MRNRYPLVSKSGRPARVGKNPYGMGVYELTADRQGEYHANTFSDTALRFSTLAELLADAGYQEVR